MDTDLTKLGTGAVPQPHDSRDYQASTVFGTVSIDWSKEFRLPEPPNENQNGSGSCVSQAWSYYHWQINRKDYSRRSLYSRIYLPAGGAYGRDGGKEIKEKGQATRIEAPDPNPQTENEMRLRNDITADEEFSDIEAEYFSLPSDIDMIAHTILYYKGSVGGVRLNWNTWIDLTNPGIPAGPDYLYHYLYRFGFHTHNGKKCIIHKSSWCGAQTGHHEHHINEDYFLSGNTYDNWVLIPKEKYMIEFVKNESKPGEYGLLVTTMVGSQYVPASTEADLKQRGKDFIPYNPDGSVDYTKAILKKL